MSRLKRDSNIVVAGTTYKVGDLVAQLANLPSSEVVGFLRAIGLTIPKKIRIAVLKKVLDKPVSETIAERANLADELGYRLTWFFRYSEYQLENLLKFYNSPSLNRMYLERLWQELLNYMKDKSVSDRDLKVLVDLSEKYTQLSDEDILAYNLALKDHFYDEAGQIDGLSQDEFRPVLYKSSTLVELRALGNKYGVNVPRRLKKDQLADIIVAELRDRNQIDKELEEKIRKMSIVVMQRFAKDNDVKASIELKKEEVIEYILSNATQTKEMYFLPSDSTIYEQEVDQVPTEPQVVVVHEEKPEVVHEEKVYTTVVAQDYSPILEELRLLRQLVNQLMTGEEEAVADEEAAPQEMQEPLVVNTASFKSDKKHWKQDYRAHMSTRKEVDSPEEKQQAEVVAAAPKKSALDEVLTVVSWIIALALLGIVIYLLINYLQGGIF